MLSNVSSLIAPQATNVVVIESVEKDQGYVAKAGTSAVGKLRKTGHGCKKGTAGCIQTFALDGLFPTQRILMLKIDVQVSTALCLCLAQHQEQTIGLGMMISTRIVHPDRKDVCADRV